MRNEREKYFDDSLSVDKIAAVSIKRHSWFAGANMIYDAVGSMFQLPYAGLAKTTFEDMGQFDGSAETSQGFLANASRTFTGMVAPARVVGSAGAALINKTHLTWNMIDDSHLRYNQEKKRRESSL